MEISVGIKHLTVEVIALVVATSDSRPLEQNLVVLAYLHADVVNWYANRANGKRLPLVVARHCCKTLRKSVAYNHVNAN